MSEKLPLLEPKATFQRYDAKCNVKISNSRKRDLSHVYNKLPAKIME